MKKIKNYKLVVPICPPFDPTRLNANVEIMLLVKGQLTPLGALIVRVRTSPPETNDPDWPLIVIVKPAIAVLAGAVRVQSDGVPVVQGKVYELEPTVTTQSVEDQEMELELGLDIVIVYVNVLVPEVTFFALIPTVGVLEVLVVKNPVRAR